MPRQRKFISWPPPGKTLLGLLGVVYVVYLVVFGNFVFAWMTGRSDTTSEHAVDASSASVVSYWTQNTMSSAIDADQLIDNSGNSVDVTQASSDTSAGKAARQDGQSPAMGTRRIPFRRLARSFLPALPVKIWFAPVRLW